MAHVDINVGQNVTLNLEATLHGNHAPLADQVIWSSSDTKIIEISKSSNDGMSCNCRAPGPETGSCTVYADSGHLQDFCTFLVTGYADTITIIPDKPNYTP